MKKEMNKKGRMEGGSINHVITEENRETIVN